MCCALRQEIMSRLSASIDVQCRWQYTISCQVPHWSWQKLKSTKLLYMYQVLIACLGILELQLLFDCTIFLIFFLQACFDWFYKGQCDLEIDTQSQMFTGKVLKLDPSRLSMRGMKNG